MSQIFQFNSSCEIIKKYNKLLENGVIFFKIRKRKLMIYKYEFEENISITSFLRFMNILIIKLNMLSRIVFKNCLSKLINLPDDVNNLILKYSTLNFNECYTILKDLSNYCKSSGVLTIGSNSESKLLGNPSESESIISGNSGCI